MNLSEIILTQEQFGTFMIVLILSYSIYAYFIKILPSNYDIKVNFNGYYLFVILYILFLIFNRIVKTNTEFSQPLTKYLIRKKNMREEPYHIKYINPFVTNLDKVDFNMKKNENKQYIKKTLNKLLLRKYVSFENILGYVKNPWEIITLKVSGSNYYLINDEISSTRLINDNMYCMNYIPEKILVLYRKHILRFKEKIFFIFEKKNKKSSNYYYRDCISKIEIDPSATGTAGSSSTIISNINTIIDTRDLRYDRQYVLFEITSNLIGVKSGATPHILQAPLFGDQLTSTDYYLSFMELLKNLKEDPNTNYFKGDDSFIDIIVVDIHFIYNQMTILDEEIMTNDDKKDYALNKFYQRQDWIEKRYFNLIKYQFSGRISETTRETRSIMAGLLTVKKNGADNDNSTIKFRKIAGKRKLTRNQGIDRENIILHLDTNINSMLKIGTNIKINFETYIETYIQGKPEKEANEPVIVKNKDTKSYEDNDLILDKNTISYISFNFLNIKNIKEYRNKMNYIASNILKKYYKEEIKSIDKIKFNVDSLQIIQLDKLLRYNRGKNRLVLDGKVITPRNIGLNYRDIKRLRESYIIFLEKILKYKKTLKENIEQGNYSLNVTNNELLSVVNNNPFNSKSKYLAQVTYIRTISSSNGLEKFISNETSATFPDSTKQNQSDYKTTYDVTGTLQKNVIALQLNIESYKKPKNYPLFVKFGTTMNIEGFSINPDKVYIVHFIRNNSTLKPCLIYLEQSLLETDNEGNTIDLTVPSTSTQFKSRINLFDCTNTFRKETIGVSNLIEITSITRFNVVFDNVPLEFKPLFADEGNTSSDNMYIDRPTYVMLNFTKTKDKTNIKHRIYENVLYKVIDIRSTSSNSSARLTLESLINLPDISSNKEEANIYKDVLVSQFINSKNYIENVFFKKVDIPTSERVISSGPSYKFVVELKNQIINISPEITRADIIGNYESTMNKIIDYIYKNEAQKIHYEIPENIGVYKDISSAVYSYKYKNELYISYEKRNNPVNLFKNYNSEFLCKKLYRGTNYALNMNSLYYLDSYQEYYNYFMNLFKNTLGLHDEINYQCSEYYKSGSMLSNLRLPVTFNKYVTFSNNYMLYYKTNIKIDDVDPKYLGKHVVINNTVCDNQLLNVQNSNRNNSRLYKTFLKDLVYKHQIGREGFEYSDAKKICERIFTVYDTNCKQKVYKEQSSNKDDYNIEYYKNNKERDNCFTILYNDEKEKNTYQFIAESKMLDPTAASVSLLKTASDKIKATKNTCEAKSEANCNADPNCSYNSNYYDPNLKTTVGKCESLIDSNMPVILDANNKKIGNIIGTHPGFEVKNYNYDAGQSTFYIDISGSTELYADQLAGKIAFSNDISNEFTLEFTSSNTDIRKYSQTGDVKTYKITTTAINVDLSSYTELKVYFKNIMFETDIPVNNNIETEYNSSSSTTTEPSLRTASGGDHLFNLNDQRIEPRGTNDVLESNSYIYFNENIYVSENNNLPSNQPPSLPTPLLYANRKYKVTYTNINNATLTDIDKNLPVQVISQRKLYIINSAGDPLRTNNVKNDANKNFKLIKTENNQKNIKIRDKENTIFFPVSNPKSKKINNKHYFSVEDYTIQQHINYIDGFKNTANNYKENVRSIETAGNLRFYPHRLAHLNEIKTSAYYGADWDDIGWINDANPQLYNKSNLVKVKDKKVMWIDKDDENAVNKGVICYGRKLDQEKIGANQKNEMYNC